MQGMKFHYWIPVLALVWLAGGSQAYSTSPVPTYMFGRLDLAAGISPAAVASGDFNGDGKFDLAVAEGFDNVISVYLAKPDGTFAAKVDYATGNSPLSVVVGDFNNDGKSDLAIANYNDGTVSILLGNGNGTFQAQTTYTVGKYPLSLVAGDFNRDGRPDLAVALSGTNQVAILAGKSGGGFTLSTVAVGNSPYGVAAGDFNNDGKLDLATANYKDGTISVLLGNGNGTFQSAVTYAGGAKVDCIAAADFNGDGRLDLAVGHDSLGTVSFLFGNGNGTFQPKVDYPVGSTQGFVLAVDLNGDGLTDLVAAGGANSVSVLLSNGDGTFLSRAEYSVGYVPVGAAAADFNGDGRMDLVVANRCGADSSCMSPGTVSVLVGKGDGTFQRRLDSPTGTGPRAVATGDFNGDGKLDLAVANYYSNTLSILVGRGDGTYAAWPSPITGIEPVAVAVGDFNGDGAPDVAVANACGKDAHCATASSGSVTVLLGNGDATFTAAASPTTGRGPSSIAVGDFNGDGNLDLAVANELDFNLTILLGNGDGTFKAAASPGTGFNPKSIAVGDFNGDGKLDLVTANSRSASLSILLGKGDGTFTVASPVFLPIKPLSVAAGDFNGDGKLDLAVANYSSNLTILLGNGDGTFIPTLSPVTGEGSQSVAVGDFNGDGKLDLAAANGSDGTVSILLGNGDGTFQNQVVYAVGTLPWGIAAATVVAPGQGGGPDLVVTNSATDSSSVSVLLGTPVPAFYPAALVFPGQPVGLPSATGNVTLTNSGNARLDFSSILATGDISQSNNCGTFLKPLTDCTLSAVFTPTAKGSRLGAITLFDNAPATPQTVWLSGNGLEPGATLNPASLTFPSQKTGANTAAQNVTLSNNGDAPLAISSITTSAEFSQSNTCGSFVSAAKSCTISVTFTPAGTGTRSGVLRVLDSAGNLEQDVTLTGTGTSDPVMVAPALGYAMPNSSTSQPAPGSSDVPATPEAAGPGAPAGVSSVVRPSSTESEAAVVPDAAPAGPEESAPPARGIVSLSTEALPFERQPLHKASVPRSVTLTNTGNALLEIRGIATNKADFAQTNNCGFSLPAGASCTIQVTFKPSKAGRIEGFLKIDAGSDEPRQVLLYGPGAQPPAPKAAPAAHP